MTEPDYKLFAELVLDEAQKAIQWLQARGMKPNLTPNMPPSVAMAILRDARHCGFDVLQPAAVPAMQPLHPDKPEPAIVAGEVWIKKASGKTSVRAPRIRIHTAPKSGVTPMLVRPENFRVGHGWTEKHWPWGCRSMLVAVLRRDWRPC